MGWISDHPEHEGYLVGVEQTRNGLFRELGYPADVGRAERPLALVQVACDCGWRSPRLPALPGTRWAPCTVSAPASLESAAIALWREHVEHETTAAAARCGGTW